MYLINIREFSRVEDAYYYKKVLSENNIESYISSPVMEEDAPLDAAETESVQLSVLSGDLDDAKQLLATIDIDYFGDVQQGVEGYEHSDLVIIKQMSYQKEAYLYKARLEDEGVTCFIVDKHSTNPLPLVGITANTIELYVPKNQLATAEMIVLEMDSRVYSESNQKVDKKPLLIGIILVLIALFLLVQQYFSMY
jgi:hypothetical protein